MTALSPRRPPPRSKPGRTAHRLAVCLALGVLFLCAPARAQDDAQPWGPDAAKGWFTAHPTPDTWLKPTDALQALLEADYKQNGAACFSQPDFQGWMEHVEWVRLGLVNPDVIAKPEDLKTFIALGEDQTLSHLLVQKLVPRDVASQAVRNLITLAQANMADLHEYAALGVAYCIVFDEPFPSYWPHEQVPQSAVPIGDVDIVKRFQFYVQANRDKKTELDLTQLRVEDLKYLVDSETKLSELEYGQKNTIPYDHFEDVFPSIRYDTRRVSEGNQVYTWAYPTYKLEDILDHGGICVDQAYYSSEIGKGRGIPTIYFTGQGIDGGHAWFGYLSRSGKWELDCGRYINQNYPKGYALDPQTWQEVNDTTLANLAKGGTDSRYPTAKVALAWARMHAGTSAYHAILEDARSIMPELPETWQEEGDSLDKSGLSIDDKKAFYQAWINQFNSYADMKVEGQKRLLAMLKAANDPDAQSLQQDIVLQNRSSGFDLGVQGSLDAIKDKFKVQDWDGAKLEYEKSVRDFEAQGGGTFYYNVVRPYMMLCVGYGRMDQAEDGIHFTEERMPMDKTSIVALDFEKLKAEIKAVGDAPQAVQKWLAEVDDGKYANAFQDGTKTYGGQNADEFVAEITRERAPFGKCTVRVATGVPQIGSQVTFNGKSESGVFYQSSYDVNFDNNTAGRERVLFAKDSDGTWRMLNYFIQRKSNSPAEASSTPTP